jgi:hypothetical protein
MHCGVMVTGYNQGDWERWASFSLWRRTEQA